MNRTPEQRVARRIGLQRALKCSTCADWRSSYRRTSTEPCLGCHEPLAYYSCAPGYCRACAHDPSWVKLSDIWPEAVR